MGQSNVKPVSPRSGMALNSVNTEGLGLEIGPSYNPIAPKSHGYNVRILDHAQATLQTLQRNSGSDREVHAPLSFVSRAVAVARRKAVGLKRRLKER